MIPRRRIWISATALEMLCASTMSADGWSQAVPAVAGDPWAIGYAVQVARFCPVWRVEKQETLARRGVLTVRQSDAGIVDPNEAFERAYYKG